MRNAYLGEFEEVVLLTVAVLDGGGYGAGITDTIEAETSRTVRLNQVHAALHRLEKKGMVTSRMGDPSEPSAPRRS
ncbi:MAG: hypothetical protein WBA12_03045 [Catalinimonas sp.]